MKISVYITSYNQKDYLREAIESVLAQTLRPYEIIIVDDCSSDGSQEMIRVYASRYPDLIVPIFHEQNQGVASVRNDAIKAAAGDYITYLDGDDRYLPTKLEKEAALLLAHPEKTHVIYSNYYFITPQGERYATWTEHETLPEGDIFCDVFASRFPGNGMFLAEMVPADAYRCAGYYDRDLPIWEDLDMRMRLTKHYHALSNPEPLVEIRRGGHTGLSKANTGKHYDALFYVYRKNRHLLNDLSRAKRRELDQLRRRSTAKRALNASREAQSVGNHREAMKYYLSCLRLHPGYFSPRMMLNLLIPTGMSAHKPVNGAKS